MDKSKPGKISLAEAKANEQKPYSGMRNQPGELAKHRLKLSLPRGDSDLKAQERRKIQHGQGLISPLPKDKDGNTSYMPDNVSGKDVIESGLGRMRSSSDKIARFLKRNGVRFSDYEDSPPEGILFGHRGKCKPVAYKQIGEQSPVAKPRGDSPFKRAKAAPVIIKKG